MKLSIQIEQSQDGQYVAFCPTLPGCRTKGKTREEARDNLNEAIRGYVAAVSNFVPENLTHEIVEA
jgi:predicted RNase H-like HicB family nuclease